VAGGGRPNALRPGTPAANPPGRPVNGQVSFWHAALGPPRTRPALEGPTEADVCIVGAGYTGLWTAWALRRARPGVRVVVLEADHVGFGASGRNGGWLSGLMAGNRDRLAAGPAGRAGVVALRRALQQAVDDVLAACAEEGIDADQAKGGTLSIASTPAQLTRLRARLDDEREWGVGPEDAWELSATEVTSRVGVDRAVGGVFDPHCARVHPAKLVRGLADAAERHGAEIFERSPALALGEHRVETIAGEVRADWIVRATEGYTAGLPGLGRELLPLNSSMIVTEPLGEDRWRQIGWDGLETIATGDHAYLYAQRTADGRIAIGGRGIPYRFRSGTDHRGATDPTTVAALGEAVGRLWPSAADVPVAHAWSGVLGVARDWCPSVGVDRRAGIAWAGGYVGDGVTASHLAGVTLADLILGEDTDRTRLAWVGHRSRRWEPEPLRWIGARGIYALYRAADRAESDGRSRASILARVADTIAGR
jgi:glycine/D-amino acid oxidase-like deaminating enzyme